MEFFTAFRADASATPASNRRPGSFFFNPKNHFARSLLQSGFKRFHGPRSFDSARAEAIGGNGKHYRVRGFFLCKDACETLRRKGGEGFLERHGARYAAFKSNRGFGFQKPLSVYSVPKVFPNFRRCEIRNMCAVVRAINLCLLGKQKLQAIIDLCHRADGRA